MTTTSTACPEWCDTSSHREGDDQEHFGDFVSGQWDSGDGSLSIRAGWSMISDGDSPPTSDVYLIRLRSEWDDVIDGLSPDAARAVGQLLIAAADKLDRINGAVSE